MANTYSRSSKETEYLTEKAAAQGRSQDKSQRSLFGYDLESPQHKHTLDLEVPTKTSSDILSPPIPTSPLPQYSYPPQYSPPCCSKELPKEATQPQRRTPTRQMPRAVSPPPKYHREDVFGPSKLYSGGKARPSGRTLSGSKPVNTFTCDISALEESCRNGATPPKPRRAASHESCQYTMSGYIRATTSSQPKQRLRVGQTADPKPPAPKKNASPTPQYATRPSISKPFNSSKIGSQASRASSKAFTPARAKRPENKALASTIKSVTGAEPSPIPASRPPAASRDTPTPVSNLLEPQYLSYLPFGSQPLPMTPPSSPPQSPPQPTEYSSAMKHGLLDATSIHQSRSRARYMTPPHSPKNSPKPEHDFIDIGAIYYPEGNVRS